MPKPIKERAGHCYTLALQAVLNGEPGTELIHGRAENFGDHAWIEHGGVVHDLVTDKQTPASDYHGVAERRYTRTAA
jgi:hypothetical protein